MIIENTKGREYVFMNNYLNNFMVIIRNLEFVLKRYFWEDASQRDLEFISNNTY